ncbi:DUF2884 family protein [Vibrio caribbeanicus]|uniref:DUF2884 family protein n=1 Tax=Vibrio caribbeanicus TaxID=701175 RepID=UPI002283786C|nr:DUF2884 family protein [Vibrio caribbeanicus]MCY9844429.1 DUF2884 family protein [Vibrio caribbeanicus]
MIKKTLVFALLLATSQSNAMQCNVDLKNGIRVNDQSVEVNQSDGKKAVFDEQGNLSIAGYKVLLDEEQKKALEGYRSKINDNIVKAQDMTKSGLELVDNIIADVSSSFKIEGSLDGVKKSVHQFYSDIEARYQDKGDLILPANLLSDWQKNGTEELSRLTDLIDKEFTTDIFEAMSTKMNKEGGLNLSELATTMSELKARVSKDFADHQKDIKEQAKKMCESLQDSAKAEQDLHQKIPELASYSIFNLEKKQ